MDLYPSVGKQCVCLCVYVCVCGYVCVHLCVYVHACMCMRACVYSMGGNFTVKLTTLNVTVESLTLLDRVLQHYWTVYFCIREHGCREWVQIILHVRVYTSLRLYISRPAGNVIYVRLGPYLYK